jgi:hypothetical protein
MARNPSTFPSYVTLLERIHESVLPRSYAEIGIRDGRSLALALPGTRVVGIDPSYSLRYVIDSGAQCFAETSDDFFAHHNLRGLLGGLPVDLAFIDGMHQFEFALRDFANLERNSGPESTILLHDCNPATRDIATREEKPGIWAGDVWKLILCLQAERPDLDVKIVDVPPTGLGVVRSLDAASEVLFSRQEELIERYIDLDFSALEAARTSTIALVPNDWESIRAVLPPSPFRPGDPTRLRRARERRTRWKGIQQRVVSKLGAVRR